MLPEYHPFHSKFEIFVKIIHLKIYYEKWLHQQVRVLIYNFLFLFQFLLLQSTQIKFFILIQLNLLIP
jgi:hypothetical protein